MQFLMHEIQWSTKSSGSFVNGSCIKRQITASHEIQMLAAKFEENIEQVALVVELGHCFLLFVSTSTSTN